MINVSIKYENSKGDVLDLSGFPYKLKIEELFDWEWEVDSVAISNNQSNISRFRRPIKNKTTLVWFYAPTDSEVAELIDTFFETTEYDVVTNQAGKLIINDGDYIQCFIVAGENRKWQHRPSFNARTVKFIFPHPFWVEEQEQAYQPTASIIDIEDGDTIHLLDYPYLYPYGYDVEVIAGGGDSGAAIRSWQFEGIAESPFVLEMYGAVTNPRVNIDGHVYQVNVTLGEDDKLVVDSRDNTIKLHRYTSQEEGTVVNAYMYQNFNSNIFQPIPCGRIIQVSSAGRFKLTVYSERSEPRWN